MTYQCIGNHKGRGGELIRCTHTSETPTWRDIYLCSSCANERPNRNSPMVETANDDITDAWKDSAEAGFMRGIRHSSFEYDKGE